MDTLVAVRGLSDPRNKTVLLAVQRYDCKVVCCSVDAASPGRRAWMCVGADRDICVDTLEG
jgi:hypothetical protein